MMENVGGKWNSDDSENTLDNISLAVRSGELLAITGSVGSGKSSILQSILGEMPICGGKIRVSGRLSYSAQESWLFAGTIRENILFGRPLHRDRYERVVTACALDRDYRQLEEGDRTVVGGRGLALSGGQRARVSLARAVYAEADIYLLDDPLSAVDVHVGRLLYSKCIRGLLKNKAVILVTHQVQYLHDADEILHVKKGKIDKRGDLNQVKDPPVLPEDSKIEMNPSCPDTETKASEETAESGEAKVEGKKSGKDTEEVGATGSVSGSVYLKYFTTGGGWLSVLLLVLLNLTNQTLYSGSDLWLSYWTKTEDNLTAGDSEASLPPPAVSANLTLLNSPTVGDDHYFYLTVYSAIIVSLLVVSMMRTVHFFNLSMTSSINLHDKMFERLLRAPPRFFDVNPSGETGVDIFTKVYELCRTNT